MNQTPPRKPKTKRETQKDYKKKKKKKHQQENKQGSIDGENKTSSKQIDYKQNPQSTNRKTQEKLKRFVAGQLA